MHKKLQAIGISPETCLDRQKSLRPMNEKALPTPPAQLYIEIHMCGAFDGV